MAIEEEIAERRRVLHLLYQLRCAIEADELKERAALKALEEKKWQRDLGERQDVKG